VSKVNLIKILLIAMCANITGNAIAQEKLAIRASSVCINGMSIASETSKGINSYFNKSGASVDFVLNKSIGFVQPYLRTDISTSNYYAGGHDYHLSHRATMTAGGRVFVKRFIFAIDAGVGVMNRDPFGQANISVETPIFKFGKHSIISVFVAGYYEKFRNSIGSIGIISGFNCIRTL